MRVFLTLLLGMLSSATAAAQDPGSPTTPPQRSSPDFLFERPSGSLAIRGSWLFARGGSDWYDFVTDQLTIDKSDFNAPGIAADVGIALSRRVDAVIGVAFSNASTVSEYRDFVDNERLPITQTTELREANVTGSVRLALAERGREVSRFAWVPRTVVPYAGAGGGLLWYRLRQAGDFVDFVDLSVFPDVFQSSGWTPTAHVFGGVDVKVHRRIYATVDGRYLWAAADLDRQWIDFDPIDLAGFRLSAGVTFLY